ncbi:hypothetical protein PF011_g27891 [Phytophthora fragariae]|nr:hypothetical protein PF011_g27891 [Phytophthora fragariae]KAE9269587.1 hypothetical protein PF008_g30825 [Phytophthora fragariae]
MQVSVGNPDAQGARGVPYCRAQADSGPYLLNGSADRSLQVVDGNETCRMTSDQRFGRYSAVRAARAGGPVGTTWGGEGEKMKPWEY